MDMAHGNFSSKIQRGQKVHNFLIAAIFIILLQAWSGSYVDHKNVAGNLMKTMTLQKVVHKYKLIKSFVA